MSDASPNGSPASPGGGKKISLEAISQAFQQELEAGRRPKIEKVLSQLKEKYHERVLRNLMMAEIGFHRRAGISPRAADYLARFPAFSEVINEVFEFLGTPSLSKPLPSALKSFGAVSMITSQSSLEFAMPVDENSAIETSTELKRTPPRRDGLGKSSGDTTTDSKARTNPGLRPENAKTSTASKGQTQKAPPQNGVGQKSSASQQAPGQKQTGQIATGQKAIGQKAPGQKKPAPKPAAPAIDDFDDDLNSLLSVQLPQEPRRKRTAEEIEEAEERLERRKERQRNKDRNKRLKVKVDSDEAVEQYAGPKTPLGEFQLPLIVTIVSAILNLVVALMITQEGVSFGMFLILKAVLLVFSFATTLLALFVAAFLLGTQYGYLHTAILKVAAICLTQAWIADLFYVVPLPLVYEMGCWIATFVMFELFFEIDTMDVVYSMVIVNVTRMIVGIYLWMLLLSLVMSNSWIVEKAAIQMQEQEAEENPQAQIHDQEVFDAAQEKARKEIDEVAKDDEFGEIPKLPAPQKGPEAEEKVEEGEEGEANENRVKFARPVRKETSERVDAIKKYTHQFANLIIVEDFEAAYELMSQEYRDKKSVADFKTELIDWRNTVGYPIGARENVETFETHLIKEKPVAEDLDVPDEKILALAIIQFSVDLDIDDQFQAAQADDGFGPKLFMVMVDEDGKMRIAAFRPGYR